MDVSTVQLSHIEEIKILTDVKLTNESNDRENSLQNVHVNFILNGEIKGDVTAYLCLDGVDLSTAEKNYLFPLFTESMNILIGKQISLDPQLNYLRVSLSPPRFIGKAESIKLKRGLTSQTYFLETEEFRLPVILIYQLERMQ